MRLPSIISILLLETMAEQSNTNDEEISCGDPVVQMYFLDRSDQWKTIKPYSFQYVLKEEFPLHNFKLSLQQTRLQNMRPLIPSLSLDSQGFEVHRIETTMNYPDFGDPEKIQMTYVSELETYFQTLLGAKKVRGLDYQLRRRDTSFPELAHVHFSKPQPSLQTHVDVTLTGLKKIVRELYGDLAESIFTARFQCITVWRPLRLPIQDWPLAVCDARSVDETDFVETDVIWPNYVAENRALHFNKSQRWFWLPDQCENEVLVFKATDSDPTKAACELHILLQGVYMLMLKPARMALSSFRHLFLAPYPEKV